VAPTAAPAAAPPIELAIPAAILELTEIATAA
jgi:hypothetical protein